MPSQKPSRARRPLPAQRRPSVRASDSLEREGKRGGPFQARLFCCLEYGERALGHDTFRDCAIAEFTFSQRRVYELLNAVEVLDNLNQFGSKPEDEGQLRELAKLRIEGTHAYDTELQKAVWQIASQTAPVSDQGRKLITASHIKSVAQVLTDVVKSGDGRIAIPARYSPVKEFSGSPATLL